MVIKTIYAYQNLRRVLRERIESLTGPLFTTDAAGLFGLYLCGLDVEKSAYACGTCAQFIQKYGGIATINEQGRIESALWTADYPTFFRLSTETMRERVNESRVTGVYVNAESAWGKPKTNGWLHLCGRLNMPVVVQADRVRDVLCREYKLLHYNLSLCDRDAVVRSIGKSIKLFRAVGCLHEAVAWFTDMQRAIRDRNDNLLWRLVAVAEPGNCQVILSLVEDIRTTLP